MKETWKILKSAIGKEKNKSALPDKLNVNGQNVTDKLQIAESFNKYFGNIGYQTSQNIPKVPKLFTEFLPPAKLNSMFLDPVGVSCVVEATMKLKSKNSMGHDGISTKILKESINCISLPLTHIINLSLESGIVPQDMKIAKVIPIHKSSDPTSLNNYRPISLLSAFSKILEKIM